MAKIKLPKTKKIVTKKSNAKPKVDRVKKDVKLKKEPEIKTEIIPEEIKINEAQILEGIKALIEYEEKTSKKGLLNEDQPIFLQVECVKIPICANRQLRLQLKHSLVAENSDVCLIVADLKKGRHVDHDPTVQHYEELLRAKNVTNITRVIPMRAIKVEYDQFELKRRLCAQFDYFLADGRICGHLKHQLGNLFGKAACNVVPIKMDAVDLKAVVDGALRKTSLHLHAAGNTYTMLLGTRRMSALELRENVLAAISELADKFPGGWENVRALYVKGERSIAVPLYLTLRSSNEVKAPFVQRRRPKLCEPVEGELSTFRSDKTVTVQPDGTVTLH